MPIDGPTVSLESSIIAGVQSDLMETWRQEMPVFRKQQELLIRFLPENGIRDATYVWKESTPFPRYWPYGGARVMQSFRDRAISLNKVPYELSIPWSLWDEKDDRIGDIRQHVQSSTRRFLQLPDVLVAEYLNGVASLNPSLKLSFDGVSSFSTVDGDGNARGGVTSGNLLTGSGATVAGLVHDMARAQAQFIQYVDPTAGKPIFDPSSVKFTDLHLIVPSRLNEIVQKAAKSEFIKIDDTNVVSESNYIKGEFEWNLNPYLTDNNSYYIVLKNNYLKPFVARSIESLTSIIADVNNSDFARMNNKNIFHAHLRTRLAPWFPFVIIKIDNT